MRVWKKIETSSAQSVFSSEYKLFTLIELLIVIAIIAILAALLLPALKKAKDTANQAVCSKNLKTIAQATFMYVNDYDDCFPNTNAWPSLKIVSLYLTGDYHQKNSRDLFYGCARGGGGCPQMRDIYYWNNDPNNSDSSVYPGNVHIALKKISKAMPRTASGFAITACAHSWAYNYYNHRNKGIVEGVHNGKTLVLMQDSHVEKMLVSETEKLSVWIPK